MNSDSSSIRAFMSTKSFWGMQWYLVPIFDIVFGGQGSPCEGRIREKQAIATASLRASFLDKICPDGPQQTRSNP
jgi:hypothetical protein